jgi:type IX secretion system PorP/SprF family membrane protein
MRKFLIIYLLFAVYTVAPAQQMTIPTLSLFDRSLSYYNPAAAGKEEALTANLFFRRQWTGEGAPSTLYFTADFPWKNPSVATGIKLEHESIGSNNYTGIFLDYAYRLRLGANTLSFGIEAGIYNGSTETLTAREDQYDHAINENNYSFLLPNFGVGALYYGKKYWISFSVPKLLGFESKESGEYGIKVAGVGRDYILAGGGNLRIKEDFNIEPSALCIYNSGTVTFMANAMAVYKERYKAGLGYRSTKALIFALAFDLNRQTSFAYSYDLFLGKVADYDSSSHEIHLRYTFGYKVNAANPRGF